MIDKKKMESITKKTAKSKNKKDLDNNIDIDDYDSTSDSNAESVIDEPIKKTSKSQKGGGDISLRLKTKKVEKHDQDTKKSIKSYSIKGKNIKEYEQDIENRHLKEKELKNELKKSYIEIEKKEKQLKKWKSETLKMEKSIYIFYKKKASSTL